MPKKVKEVGIYKMGNKAAVTKHEHMMGGKMPMKDEDMPMNKKKKKSKK